MIENVGGALLHRRRGTILFIHDLTHGWLLPRLQFSQFSFQHGTNESTSGVALLLEGIKLLFQLDGKLNHNANELGHVHDSLETQWCLQSETCAHAMP